MRMGMRMDIQNIYKIFEDMSDDSFSNDSFSDGSFSDDSFVSM